MKLNKTEMQSVAYQYKSRKYQFRNLLTFNGMLPPTTLNLDAVTQRTRDNPEINPIVTGQKRQKQWQIHLRRHGPGQCYPWASGIEAARPVVIFGPTNKGSAGSGISTSSFIPWF